MSQPVSILRKHQRVTYEHRNGRIQRGRITRIEIGHSYDIEGAPQTVDACRSDDDTAMIDVALDGDSQERWGYACQFQPINH